MVFKLLMSLKPLMSTISPCESVFITKGTIDDFIEPCSYMLHDILFLLLETVLLTNVISRIRVNFGRFMEKGAV